MDRTGGYIECDRHGLFKFVSVDDELVQAAEGEEETREFADLLESCKKGELLIGEPVLPAKTVAGQRKKV